MCVLRRLTVAAVVVAVIVVVVWIYKVLACDPEDAIIADGSSTKSGVSVMLELGASSSSLDVYQPPKVCISPAACVHYYSLYVATSHLFYFILFWFAGRFGRNTRRPVAFGEREK